MYMSQEKKTILTIFLFRVFTLRVRGRRGRRLCHPSAVGRRGAEAGAGVALGFGWRAAAAMLGLGVGVVSVLQTCVPGTDGVAGL